MRCYPILAAALVAVGATGCERLRSPKLSLPPGKASAPSGAPTVTPPAEPTTAPTAAPSPTVETKKHDPNCVYCGRTLAEWDRQLQSSDRDDVMEACRALHVMGPEGRPSLFAGLTNARPETRRLCFERLTLADFKREGEEGRLRLVRLAGDKGDFRIRERAVGMLSRWHTSLSAP